VSFNEERLTPIYTPYAGRVLEVLANKGTEVRPGGRVVDLHFTRMCAMLLTASEGERHGTHARAVSPLS
jgi:hypothetical protein